MTASEDRLSDTFRAVATRIRADYDAAREQVRHQGIRGKVAEDIVVSGLLERYLPKTVRVQRGGEIVSASGDISKQIDVLICDPATPPLWADYGVEIVPAECVYGAIEVKSVLDGDGLQDAWRMAAEIKQFPKTAYLRGGNVRIIIRYGKEWFYNPTAVYLFAHTSRIHLDRLRERLWNLALDTEPEHRLDGVWILDQGSFTWRSETSREWITAQPGPVWCMTTTNPDEGSPIPLMVMQLQRAFQDTISRPFNIADYMGNLPLGRPSLSGPPGSEWLE